MALYSLFSIGLLAIIGLAVLAALGVISMLLASPSTRGAGLTFLGVGGLLVLLMVVFAGFNYVNVRQEYRLERTTVPVQVRLPGEVSESDEGAFDYANGNSSVAPQSHSLMMHTTSATGDFSTWFVLLVPLVAIALVGIALGRGDASLWGSVLGLGGGAIVAVLCGAWWWTAPSMPVGPETEPTRLASVASDKLEAWDFATAPRIVVELEDQADETQTDETTLAETGDKPNRPAKPERPEWVDQELFRSGNVVRRAVSAGPYATLEECEQELLAKIDASVCRQVELLTGTRPSSMRTIEVTQPYVMSECLVEQYAEQSRTQTGFEVWTQHVLLEFTPTVDNYLLDQFHTSQRYDRVSKVAMGGGGVLGMLAVVLGMLRLDTATKGYYTKRLFIGVPVAIIGILGLLAWMA